MKKQEHSSTVRCPYLPEHVMHVDSLLTHLNRCKATNKHLFRTCLYNSLHVVPRQTYDQHIRRCEDAAKNRQQNEHEEWEQERKGPKLNIHYDVKQKSRNSSDDFSSQSWSCSDESSNQGYGYYDQWNPSPQYNNNYQSQYNKVEPANPYQYDELSYLRPASTTPNPLKKKKGNKTTLEEDRNFNYYYGQAQRLNATLNATFNILGDSAFNSKKAARVRNQSDRQTLEESDDKKIKLMDSQQIKTKMMLRVKSQDEQILSFLNQLDKTLNIIDPAKGYGEDSFGDLLYEQASMLKSKRNIPNISGITNISNISFTGRSGDGVGTLTRF